MNEQQSSKQEIARQLREWYESGWIRDNTLNQKQAELLWAAIGSLTADEPTSAQVSKERLAQALRNLRDVAHREVSPRYSAALDEAFTLADIALGEFDSEGEVSREADVGPGGGVRATHATGSAPSKPGAAEPPASAGVKCTHCNGKGYNEPIYDEQDGWIDETPCETCNGSGRITTVEQYLKTLPANWHEDSSLETWFPITAEELKRLKDERASQPPSASDEFPADCDVIDITCDEDDERVIEFAFVRDDICVKGQSVTKSAVQEYQKASLSICEHPHVDFGRCTYCDAVVGAAVETSAPRWQRAGKPWSEYPIGTVARQSWTGCKWTKTERGWKAHVGDTFPIPGGADEVAVSEEGRL